MNNRFITNEEIIATARAAVDALSESTDLDLISLCRFGYGFNLIWYGRFSEADCELHEAFNMVEKTGNVTMQVRCLAYRIVAN